MSKFISVLLVTTLYVETTLQHQKFSPRHSATLGFSSESKCRENFNYKHPHPCTPGKDCFFVVKWQPLEELEEEEKAGEKQKWVEFEVTADLTGLNLAASFWVALGFSSNSAMGDSDVIGCLQHADGSSDVLDGYNLADDHKFLPDRERGESSPHQLQVVLNATKLQGEMFTCNFHRLVDTGDVIQDRMLREHQFVLAAVGSLRESSNGNKSRMLKHLRYAASSCACDVLSCNQACSCPVGFFYQMLKLHGIVMSISFMLLIPTGSIVSRYYKAVFNNAWFKAHVTLMMIGVLWSLLGLTLVLIHTRGVFSVGVHQILGILVLALAVVQPMVGFLRPLNQPTKL